MADQQTADPPPLYPTKTRLALLRDIRSGLVFRDVVGDSYIGAGAKVTARVAEFEVAGWAELRGAGQPGSFQLPRWCITAAGEAVLAQHPEEG